MEHLQAVAPNTPSAETQPGQRQRGSLRTSRPAPQYQRVKMRKLLLGSGDSEWLALATDLRTVCIW